jgi:hypothetical protein
VKNQLYTGTPTSRRQVTLPNVSALQSPNGGVPILVGAKAGVTLDSYQAIVTGATVLFSGTFNLSVTGSSSDSPVVGLALNPGDPVYAHGTKDNATNVTYSLVLNGNSSDTLFGHIDPTGPGVGSGLTAIVGVVINAIS